MIVTIQAAHYLDGYRLFLTFNTGESGEVDLQDLIFKYQAASPLRNVDEFKAFKLDEWSTVVWDCGFDVSPETLYERATGKRVEWLEFSTVVTVSSINAVTQNLNRITLNSSIL